MTEFEAGSKALFGNMEVTVKGGPFPEGWNKNYVIEKPDGDHVYVLDASLKPVPPADPRRDVVAKALHDYRYPGRVDGGEEHRLDLFRGEAVAVLKALGDLGPVEYEDRVQDVWGQQPDGAFQLIRYSDGSSVSSDTVFTGYTLSQLRDEFGPLKQV